MLHSRCPSCFLNDSKERREEGERQKEKREQWDEEEPSSTAVSSFAFWFYFSDDLKEEKRKKETKKEKNWMKKNLAPQPLPQLLIPTSCQRSSSPWIETIANAKWKTSSREDDKPCQIQKM